MSWPWSELGLSGPADLPEVRRAYAERLKTTHPEEDPEGFQRLHEAYRQARRLAREGGKGDRPAPSPQAEPDEGSNDAPDGDCGELLRTEEEPAGEPEPEKSGWDYEGIFTQEAVKRARAWEEHAQERREAYFAKHGSASPEEARELERRWTSLEKALAAVEELSAGGASLYEWVGFLHSSVFFAVKGDGDFVAGLEDFLRRNPDLDEQVKQELSKAFGLRHGEVPPLWQGLHELLNGVERNAPKNAEKPAKKRRTALIAAAVLLLLTPPAFYLLPRAVEYFSGLPGAEDRERLCRYMEEDFGRAVESRWEGRAGREDLYAPWDQPELTFMAWPDGERDLAAGRRGYTTNYSDVMVAQTLEDFAEEWDFELIRLQAGSAAEACDTLPGGYVLKLPLRGGEEGLAALGGLMAELEREPWYQAFPPAYELHFAYQNLTYLTYTSEGPFDGAAVLDYYEKEAGCALCAYLVEESGLAREDFDGGGCHLESQGSVELAGKPWFLVSGLDETSGEAVRQYIFDGIYLTSIPAEEFGPDMKAYQLNGDRFNSTWEDIPRFLWISRR